MPNADTLARLTPQLAVAGPYVTGEDHLRLSAFANGSPAIVVSGLILTPEGRLKPFQQQTTVAANRSTPTTFTIGLPEGWLMGVRVVAAVTSFQVAAVFVRVELVRGLGPDQTPLMIVAQGVVTTLQGLGWPGSPLRASVDGPGALFSITGTNPAAGVEITETVPAGARWRLHAFQAQLVTDVTVISRDARFVIDDGANIFFTGGDETSQTANTTNTYATGSGIQRTGTVGPFQLWPCPVAIELRPGYRLRTVTTNFQAGDNWGAPQYLIEEWLEAA
jgi:hypothetical protein